MRRLSSCRAICSTPQTPRCFGKELAIKVGDQQIVHRGDHRERREIRFHILRTCPQMTQITQIKSLSCSRKVIIFFLSATSALSAVNLLCSPAQRNLISSVLLQPFLLLRVLTELSGKCFVLQWPGHSQQRPTCISDKYRLVLGSPQTERSYIEKLSY
jgi:hypothetical protein